jgi:aspartate 1-decarboxylase
MRKKMQVELVKSKIHRARLTECDLEYEGSLGIDLDLLDLVGMLPYEKVLVVNATNGARLVTYAIPHERGSRAFILNGAAARLGTVGDVVTIMSFAQMDPEEAAGFQPRVAVLDAENKVWRTRGIEA